MDEVPVGEDWSIRFRTVEFIKKVVQLLEDGGVNGYINHSIVITDRTDFVDICTAIIRGLAVSGSRESKCFSLIRTELLREWKEDITKHDSSGGDIYPLLKSIREWGNKTTAILDEARQAGFHFEPIKDGSGAPNTPSTGLGNNGFLKSPSGTPNQVKSGSGKNLTPGKRSGSTEPEQKSKVTKVQNCTICGRTHGTSTCLLRNHPNANHTSLEWENSFIGGVFKGLGLDALPSHKQLDQSGKLIPFENGPQLPYKVKPIFNLNNMSYPHTCNMYFRADITKLGTRSVKVLLDTGAEGGNYIDSQYAENCSIKIHTENEGHLVRLANGTIVEATQYLIVSLYICATLSNAVMASS